MVYVHNLNPVLFKIGIFEIRWYGLFWLLGFLFAYWFLLWLSKKKEINLNSEEVSDFIVFLLVGTIIGARVFYIIFYNFLYYVVHPLETFFLWQGGLSFHGGLVGALFAGWLFSKKYKKNFLELADAVSIPLAIGLFFGRIGNFINAELIGRKVSENYLLAVDFGDGPRHPSQLYESAKNLLIALILYFRKPYEKVKGMLFAYLILLYSILRFFIGFVREPDPQIGYLAFGLTMGQYLNIILFICAIIFIYYLQYSSQNKAKV